MSETPQPTSATVTIRKSMPLWTKALLIVSVVAMAAGVALPFIFGGDSPPPPTPAGSPGVPGVPSLTGEGAASASSPGAAWSPHIFRVGFSFFVAFVIAYALRAFVKIALIGLGFVLLILFGLQYSGLVDVRWGEIQTHYDEASEFVQRESSSFKSFVTGYLPSISAAGVGFFAGFRRK